MKFKPVFRRDTDNGIFRLFRLLWIRGNVGDGKGYSAKFSVALSRRMFGFERQAMRSWMITLLFVRLHYQRAYGGYHT